MKRKPKFKKGQLLQNNYGQWGTVEAIESREDGYWYRLDGDMYPRAIHEKDLRGVTKRQIG